MARAPLGSDMAYKFELQDLADMDGPVERVALGSMQPKEDLALWHRRLGYRNHRGIEHAISHGLMTGPELSAARKSKHGLCDACVKAKSTRHSFSKAGIEAKGKSAKFKGLAPHRKLIFHEQ